MYKLLDFEEVLALDLVEERERRFSEYNSFVVFFPPNGDKPQIIARDGGEPEDQVLHRAYSWVVPELNKAYMAGYESAHKDNDQEYQRNIWNYDYD